MVWSLIGQCNAEMAKNMPEKKQNENYNVFGDGNGWRRNFRRTVTKSEKEKRSNARKTRWKDSRKSLNNQELGKKSLWAFLLRIDTIICSLSCLNWLYSWNYWFKSDSFRPSVTWSYRGNNNIDQNNRRKNAENRVIIIRSLFLVVHMCNTYEPYAVHLENKIMVNRYVNFIERAACTAARWQWKLERST